MTPADRRALVGVAYVFAAITAAGVLLALCTAGCTPRTVHAVQATPASWTLPPRYAHCTVGETVRWPNGVRTVVVRCPQRSVLVDPETKRDVDLDTLDFRKGT